MNRNNEMNQKRWERAWRRSNDPNAMRWHGELARLTWGIVAAMPLILLSLLLVATQSGIAGAIGILALLWTGFLAMTFAVYVARTDRISGVGKVGWMASFLFAAPIALPVFWLMHVWNAPRPRALRNVNRKQTAPRIPDRAPITHVDVRRLAESSQGAS